MTIIEVLSALTVLGAISFFVLLVYLVIRVIGWLLSGSESTRMSSEEVQLEVWKGERTARRMDGRGNSAWDTAAFNLAKKDLNKHD